MAKITFRGVNEYSAKLARLSDLARDRVIGPAVYDGAALAADSVRQLLNSIPTDEKWGTPGHPKAGPTKAELEGLKEGFGVAPLQDDNGFINVKIGFSGYNAETSKRWPKGKPNLMVARSVNSGTSYMTARPFMKEAMRRSRKAILEAMGNRVNKEIEKIMK